jgi:hypothetical protein
MAHAGRQSPSAKREQNGIDAVEPVEELEADRARAFAGVEVFAVLDEKGVAMGRDLPGALAGVLDVALDQFDRRAQAANAIDLRGVGACPATTMTARPRARPL